MTDDEPDLTGWERERDGLMADYEHIEVGFDLIPFDPERPSRTAVRPGGRQQAMLANEIMLQLPAALAKRGGRVFEVEGWQYRGASGRSMADTIYGSISHWIVSEFKPDQLHANQTLGVIVNGHSKLAGPLANLYLAWDGRIGIVAGGRANHGGEGSWRGISGNQFWIGTEAEGGPGFTDAQLAAYPIIVCAIADVTGRHPRDWAISHQEYAPRRKQDIGAYIRPIRNDAIAMYEQQGDDMAQVPQEQWNALYNMVKFNYDATLYEPGGYGFPEANNGMLNEVKALTTKVIELLLVPGQGFTWDAANSNKLDGLVTQLEAISAVSKDGSVDVQALATRLAEILPGEVKKALGEALLK